jgi:hypothetical protein
MGTDSRIHDERPRVFGIKRRKEAACSQNIIVPLGHAQRELI